MQIAYFRGNRINMRLNDLELKKLKEIMQECGQENISETIRHLIHTNHNGSAVQGSMVKGIKT